MVLHVYREVVYWGGWKGCRIINGKQIRCRNIWKSAKRVYLLVWLHVSPVCTLINNLLSRFPPIHLHKWTRNMCVFIGGLPEVTQKSNLCQFCVLNIKLLNSHQYVWKQCHSRWNNRWCKMAGGGGGGESNNTHTNTTEGGAKHGTYVSRYC